MEIRTNQTELTSDGDLLVEGYVNKPGSLSQILGSARKFKEKIAPGAFTKAIENRTKDINLLAEHDGKKILSSTRNGSLELREDERGLFMSAKISPTSWGRDYYQMIKDGLIGNMSFGFRTLKDSWERSGDLMIRTVHELELFEVSAVENPAYLESAISARGIDVIDEVQVPNEISEHSENKQTERGNQTMVKMKMEKRGGNEDLEGFLRDKEVRSLQMTGSGAAVIPENVADSIVLKMEEVSPVFAQARKLDSIAGRLSIAKENDSLSAGFVGEGNPLTEGGIGFEEVKLEQKRVGAAISLSNQLVNDAAVNLVDYSKNLLARRTVKAVEAAILSGQGGTEDFKGIIHDVDVEAVEVVGTTADVTLESLVDLYLAIHPDFMQGAAFTMNRSFFNELAKKKDNQGHFYVQNGIVNGKLTYTLFGMEINITDSLPAETPVVFGNIAEAYTVLIKKGFEMKHITADTTQAMRGSQLLVFDGYMDGAVHNPQAVAKLVLTPAV